MISNNISEITCNIVDYKKGIQTVIQLINHHNIQRKLRRIALSVLAGAKSAKSKLCCFYVTLGDEVVYLLLNVGGLYSDKKYWKIMQL